LKAIPRAVPEVKIDVAQRVEELQKYLRENKFPAQQKNIMAVIAMYNRKELPKPGTNAVSIQDGKLTKVTVDCLLRPEPVWTEVCLRQQARIYLIHAIGLLLPVYAGPTTSATVCHIWVQWRSRRRTGIVDDPPKYYYQGTEACTKNSY
jgi:hypothetical protein